MARRKRNKKGSLLDAVTIGALLLVFAVGILISYKIMNEFNTKMQDSATLDKMVGANRSKAALNQLTGFYPGVIDNSFLLLTIGLAIVALILAMLVRIHPVFFVFYFIMLAIIIFISGIFSNIYQRMAQSTAMSDVASQLIFTSHILEYLPFIVGIVGMLIALVMYKSYQAAQQ